VIAAIVLIVIAIVFVAQNTAEATMSFLWFDFTAPVWLGFLVDVVIGVAIGFLLGRARYRGPYR
jgi:uncharacterized integral membrane protein